MRFLLLRRFVQLSLIIFYVLAHYFGINILTGNLSGSLLLGTIPFSDPFATLQLFLAGGVLGLDVILGAVIIAGLYGIIFGRGYCAFVCPVNLITDHANYMRRKFAIKGSHWGMSKKWRYYILATALVFTPVVGLPLFELVSPIGLVHRGIIFGLGYGWVVIVSIWLFDFLMVQNGFCSHLCPVGAFYSILGKFSLIKVHHDKEKCTLCMECKSICPEKQVLSIIGKESGAIKGIECCNCGRCIDVCNDDALTFNIRDFIKKEK